MLKSHWSLTILSKTLLNLTAFWTRCYSLTFKPSTKTISKHLVVTIVRHIIYNEHLETYSFKLYFCETVLCTPNTTYINTALVYSWCVYWGTKRPNCCPVIHRWHLLQMQSKRDKSKLLVEEGWPSTWYNKYVNFGSIFVRVLRESSQ